MSAQTITRRLTQADLAKLYQAGDKVVMFTCYDASFARLLDAAGVEVMLIGDSLGNVIQGHDTTLPVTVADIAYHTAAVKRGSDHAFIIADMPFGSYQESPEQAFRNAVTLMAAGAQMVKLEGGLDMAKTVEFLVHRGIPVCGHVGLTPQSVHALGGYKVQGKNDEAAESLLRDARALADAGVFALVMECVPALLANEITQAVSAPTIGIGAGKYCDGQILVSHDVLGLPSEVKPKFVKAYASLGTEMRRAFESYKREVEEGLFPSDEQSY